MTKTTRIPSQKLWYRLMLVMSLLFSLAWSWMFFVQVAQLSASITAGYVTASFAFVITVAVSLTLVAPPLKWLCQRYYAKERLNAWFIVEIALVWALIEFIVASGLALVWLGRDGSLDSQLAFGSLTPLLMYTPLKFLARLVGFYGLSAVFVALISSFGLPKLRRFAPWVTAAVVLATIATWLPYRQVNGSTIKVQLTSEHLTEKLPTIYTDADIVLFPEYGLDDIAPDKLGQRVQAIGGKDVVVIGSKQYLLPAKKRVQNMLVFGTTQRGFVSEQAKVRLAPAGEYLPYLAEWSLRGIGANNLLETFNFERAVQKGRQGIVPLVVSNKLMVGSEVCASIISPEDYRKLVMNGSSVLTNSASLQIFNGSPIFTAQHEGFARFMAVANVRPVLQSSNGGQAFALDHNGQLVTKLWPMNQAEVTANTNHKRTPYTVLGEWVVWAGFVWLAVRISNLIWRRHISPKILKGAKDSTA